MHLGSHPGGAEQNLEHLIDVVIITELSFVKERTEAMTPLAMLVRIALPMPSDQPTGPCWCIPVNATPRSIRLGLVQPDNIA